MPMRRRIPGLPRLGTGLVVFGLATYVFLALGARTMGPPEYSDFAFFWGVVYGVGIGVCLPFEQEVSRQLAQQRTIGADAGVVLKQARTLGAAVCLGLTFATLPVVPVSHKLGIDDGWLLWALTSVAMAALMVAYISRGALAGEGRWSRYSSQLALEGLVRASVAAGLAYLAVQSLWTWALLVPVALIVGVVSTGRHSQRVKFRPSRASAREVAPGMARAVGTMMIATVIGQSLVNIGPTVVRLLDTSEDQGDAGRFLATMLLARAPIFLFAAIQPILVPVLATFAAKGEITNYRKQVRDAMRWTASLGALGVLACLFGGPEILGLLGPQYRLSRLEVTLCGVSMALYLGTLVLQPAAIAVGEHWRATWAWLLSGGVFLAVVLVPLPPILAVETALIAACVTALVALSAAVRHGLHVPVRNP